MKDYGPPERVYVENDWYDGSRAGIADVDGRPHRFKSIFDESAHEYLGIFAVWLIDDEQLGLEIEQWQIFVDWNARYEAGEAGVESHPGHGGVSSRWDELEKRLESSRATIPPDARRAVAQLVGIERSSSYEASGPSYMMRWKTLRDNRGGLTSR